MSEKLDKVKRGLAACSIGLYCPDEECPYAKDKEEKEENCIALLARDALALIREQEAKKAEARAMLRALEETAEAVPWYKEKMPAHLVPRELLLHTWGHGWEESHLIGDDEDPERFDLTECVWINGHIMEEEGSDANAASDYWAENYGKKYGMRIWTGDEMPTDEQRRETPWRE